MTRHDARRTAAVAAAGLLLGLGTAAAEAQTAGAPELAGKPGAAEAAPPEAVRLERTLAGIRGLRADFVQIRDVALTGEHLESRGFLAYRPPQAFRLVFTNPERQELVIRGDSLWVIMPSENQAQRYPFEPDAPGSEVFLLFGASQRRLTDVFHVVEEEWGSYARALHLTPRNPDPGYPLEEIRLVIGNNGYPERLFLREVTGDTVVFRFVKIQRDPPDIDRLIRLELPPGIEVIAVTPAGSDTGLPIEPD
jgi:outer membrane lipoprotein-sorting protein